MSCSHCHASEQPAGRTRSRFCVTCGHRLPPSVLPSRRIIQRTVPDPAPTPA